MKQSAWPSVFVLALGVFALVFLVAIDRQPWLQVRPASAATMSQASDRDVDASRPADPARFSRG